jgi:hypothetical protein
MPSNVVQILETNGAVGSSATTAMTNINFGSADLPNLTTAAHKVIIGTSSFTKWLQFQLVTNNNTSDGNIRFFKASGTYVTGELLGTTAGGGGGTYNQVTITTYGHANIANGGGLISPMPYNGNGTAITGLIWTNGSQIIQTSLPIVESLTIGAAYGGTLTANGSVSNFGALAISSTASTPVGAANTKVITFTYDEV